MHTQKKRSDFGWLHTLVTKNHVLYRATTQEKSDRHSDCSAVILPRKGWTFRTSPDNCGPKLHYFREPFCSRFRLRLGLKPGSDICTRSGGLACGHHLFLGPRKSPPGRIERYGSSALCRSTAHRNAISWTSKIVPPPLTPRLPHLHLYSLGDLLEAR